MNHSAPTLLFHNKAGQVLADSAGFLRIDWGPQARTLPETQQLFKQLTRGLQQHKWSRVLITQLEMLPFSGPEQRWIATEWLPDAVQAGGYRHGAIVVSPDVLVRLSTAYVTTHVQGLPLVYRSFDNEAAARQWLLQQPVSPWASTKG